MPISWNTHPHNINKMTLIFFCFDNETKNKIYSLEVKIRYAIKMNHIGELKALRDDEELY